MTTGALPDTAKERSEALLKIANQWGNQGFGDFIKMDGSSELRDCWGKRFEFAVSDDRVAVTSDPSVTFYFAEIPSGALKQKK